MGTWWTPGALAARSLARRRDLDRQPAAWAPGRRRRRRVVQVPHVAAAATREVRGLGSRGSNPITPILGIADDAGVRALVSVGSSSG